MAKKNTEEAKKATEQTNNPTSIGSTAELKNFLIALQDKMNGDAAPIFAVSAMNHVLSLPDIYNYLDTESRELMRAIWLKLKSSGATLRQPPLLFGDEAEAK